MTLQFGILGPLEARRDGTIVELGPPKQKAVLAVLLISANQVVSLDRLIEMLWGEYVPARAHGTLQAYVHNLRKVLEPDRAARSQSEVLVTQPPGYVLHVEPDRLDASKFEMLAAYGHRLLGEDHPAAAKERLAAALGLWRGQGLADFTFEQFAQPETARLEEVRAVVREDLLEAELAVGNHATVIGDITVAVGEHPLRERLWRLLMLALYRSGRQGEALRAFAMARHTLAEELGIEPSAALRSLEAAILAQSPALDFRQTGTRNGERLLWGPRPGAAGFNGLEGLDGPETMSGRAGPVAPTPKRPPLVGRAHQLQQLMSAMSQARAGQGRVVLLSGEAGIGKTRLAEELVAEAERDAYLVAWGRGYERDGAPPYWLWSQVAGELARRSAQDLLRKALVGKKRLLRRLLPDIDALVGDVDEPAAPTPDSAFERFALFEAMTGLLVALADSGVVVVVLEDLQWVDPLSLQLLEHMAARFQSSHALLIATSRPPENYREGPLADTVGVLARHSSFDWIALDGLSRPDVDLLVAQSGIQATAAQVSEIHARTEGNPFFVSDFARRLATRGQGQPGLIPNITRAVIQHGLNCLPVGTRRLLVVGAAMGRDFDIRAVAAATRATLEECVEGMHSAVLAGVVAEDAQRPGMYRFCRGLVRDTLGLELGGLCRNTLHAFACQADQGGDAGTAGADHPREACG